MSALAVVSRTADHDAEDFDLVAQVRAGDDRAFEALYARYQPRITAYVRGMVHDHGRAEDITQEVFISALRRMRGTDTPIAFKPWIYEIAKNACIDAWRRSRNANEVSFDAQDGLGADDHGRLADPGASPDSAVDNKDALDNLCGAFGGLSQTHHEILVMREFEGLSYREIGERLGMSRPGVESTLFRARRRLSEEYEELVSGERCLRVQKIIDTSGARAAGVRDQRRMARHLSHCQPCRRYAHQAGVDLGVPARPAAAAKIAGWVPLPLFLRRRWGGEEASGVIAHSHQGSLTQWTTSVAGSFDPAAFSGFSKAVATVATVAVASVGAGAAITEHRGAPDAGSRAPAVVRSGLAQGSTGAASAAAGGRVRARSGSAPATPAAARGGTSDPAGSGSGSAAVTPRQPPASAGGPGAVTQDVPRAAGGPGSTSTATTLPALSPGHSAAAAPSSSTPVPAPPAALGHVVDALGSGGKGSGGSGATPPPVGVTSPAAAATQPAGPVNSAVDGASGLLNGTLAASATGPTLPAAGENTKPAGALETLQSTVTALAGSVSDTVSGTLATAALGRPAP
jgi:RNA polymerase sigma factor (sigma-70 family)